MWAWFKPGKHHSLSLSSFELHLFKETVNVLQNKLLHQSHLTGFQNTKSTQKNTLFLRLKNNICAFEKLLIDI